MPIPIAGHQRQINYLDLALARGRLPHAYLFYGPGRVGKFTIAERITKTFYCRKSPKSIAEACNACPECLQIEKNIHPHVVKLSPAFALIPTKEKREEISIDDIRELKRKFSFAPQGSRWRVAIIDQAEAMSSDAANSFLKLLEEPGAQTLFILISALPDLLLPTIISRTQTISFSQLPDKDLLPILASFSASPHTMKKMLALAHGRPGILHQMLADSSYADKESEYREKIQKIMSKADLAELFLLTERAAANEEMRERMIYNILEAGRARLAESSTRTDRAQWIARLKQTHHIYSLLETTNVNHRLALDAAFLEFFAQPT